MEENILFLKEKNQDFIRQNYLSRLLIELLSYWFLIGSYSIELILHFLLLCLVLFIVYISNLLL